MEAHLPLTEPKMVSWSSNCHVPQGPQWAGKRKQGQAQGRVHEGCLSLHRAEVSISSLFQHVIKLLQSCSESPGMRNRML